MLNITVVGDREVIARFSGMNERIRQRLFNAATILSLKLEAYVKSEKLSGQVLNVVTGHLRQSIHSEATQDANSVTGRVFSAGPMPYAAIHEFGGQVPDRYPVNAEALHFMIGGKEIFAKFARGFTMPERSYLRSSLTENKDQIIKGLTEAVEGAAHD